MRADGSGRNHTLVQGPIPSEPKGMGFALGRSGIGPWRTIECE